MQVATPCDLLLTADFCLTQDEKRRVLEKAALAIHDGLVLDIGLAGDIEPRYAPAARKDLGKALIIPGLVNAHTHAAMTLFRGLADDLPLMEWLEKRIWPVEARLNAELVHLGSLLAAAEMLRTGTTCFADMYFFEQDVARAVEQSGMRAVLGEGLLEFPTCSYANLEQAFERNLALFEALRGNPRVRAAVAPHAVYTNTRASLERAFALAEEHDLPYMIHYGETWAEIDICLHKFGKRPLTYLDELGALSPRTVLVHSIYVEDDELARIAESGANIAHNPRSNHKLASGRARLRGFLNAGVNVGLGTDGAASNNNLNLFFDMATSALSEKVRTMDPTVLPAQTVLDMATIGSAKALGWPELGRLAPGAPADLAALDLSAPNLQPMYSPVSHMVYAASGHEVFLTIVAGKVLYERGTFTTFDYPALIEEIDEARKWILAQNS